MPKVPAKLDAHAGGVVGPDGTHVGPGQLIPASWPAEVRKSLYDSGGATAKPVSVGPQAATGEPELVDGEAVVGRSHGVG